MNVFLQVERETQADIITAMPELDEMITTREAWELAQKHGESVSQQAITDAARAGNIVGARKLWNNEKAPWIFSRESFLHWLGSRRSPGRPPKISD